jgi:hypothetical protein
MSPAATVTHDPLETEMSVLAAKMIALSIGDKITFDPPLDRAQEEWLFRCFRTDSEKEMQFRCTRTEDPSARGLKRFFGALQLHAMTRIR